MRIFLAVSFLLAFATVVAPLGKCTADDRPNVLFIAVDDLNDWIGCLGGHPQTKSPNIDKLASQGMLFTRAYCAAPACNPSRAALMTGVRPSTSGVYLNAQDWRGPLKHAETLPQLFIRNGYSAVGCGKIYHGAFPHAASWQDYFKSPGNPKPAKTPVNGIPRTSHFDWGPVSQDDAEMGDHHVVDWAIKELGEEHEKPFFIACGIYRPHLPWYVPQKYFEMFPLEEIQLPTIKADDLKDVPPAGVKMAKPQGDHKKVTQSNNHAKAVQGYLASIAFADAELGRLMNGLQKSGHADNTVVVLWGDHGWHLGEKLHWRKFSLWEEATRAPLMIVAPGVTKPGQKCDTPVSFMDIYPTIADLCGVQPKDHIEGRSLKPLLVDPDSKWNFPVLTTHGRNNHAIRSQRYRYIRYADGGEELYDHDNDEYEWKNLADDPRHADAKAELKKWLPKKNAENAKNSRGGERGT